ncbi:MAG: hypothetical protein ACKO23_16995 [Gemmataceae bacterium]
MTDFLAGQQTLPSQQDFSPFTALAPAQGHLPSQQLPAFTATFFWQQPPSQQDFSPFTALAPVQGHLPSQKVPAFTATFFWQHSPLLLQVPGHWFLPSDS